MKVHPNRPSRPATHQHLHSDEPQRVELNLYCLEARVRNLDLGLGQLGEPLVHATPNVTFRRKVHG